MSKQRKSYTEEFKREAVRLMETSGKPITELARDLDINDNNLYRWRAKYGDRVHQDNPANITEMEAELRRLRRENEVLRQERDVLKKAMHIVSRSQP